GAGVGEERRIPAAEARRRVDADRCELSGLVCCAARVVFAARAARRTHCHAELVALVLKAPVRGAATAPLSGDKPRELSARIGRCAVGGRDGLAGFVSGCLGVLVDRVSVVLSDWEVWCA